MPHFGQFRILLRDLRIGLFDTHAGADLDPLAVGFELLQFGDLPDVDDVAQLAHLLGDPQADVGAAGKNARGRLGLLDVRERLDCARRVELLAGVLVVERVVAFERGERRGERGDVHRRFRRGRIEHAHRRIDDRPIAGAAAQVAGQRIADRFARGHRAVRAALLVTMLFVYRPHRHDEARRAEAALRAVAFDHRLLHRMQRAVRLAQVFDGVERFAVERGHELDARVDRLEVDAARRVALADHDRACAAVAFGAAFLGAGAMRVFAQILQHGAGDGRVLDLADRVAVVEANRLSHVSLLSNVLCPWGRAAAMVRKLSPSIKPTHSAIRMRDIFAKAI